MEAIREPQTGNAHGRGAGVTPKSVPMGHGIKANDSFHAATSRYVDIPGGRNRRNVWAIAGEPYSEAHFATFPTRLPELCLLAGSRAGDTVLNPFSGSGSTGVAALRNGRRYIGVDLKEAYHDIARRRLARAHYETTYGMEHAAERPVDGQMPLIGTEAAGSIAPQPGLCSIVEEDA